MSIFDIIYTILISPLQLFFEVVYMITNKVINNPGLSIIVLSLAMNFLVLPLYRRADAMQEEERDIEAKLHKGVAHIKKTFKGDERMMMLNTYYRQNDYKPTYVFKGAISLFLEIPFFIAAYQFLSHLELLQGVSFGVLPDLGAADALIVVSGMHFNLLPLIMTGVNLISCVIFTKGYPTKTKVQLYSMAVFFFFFLYNSPSGLVFYWTLNNLFSLVKTIFYKLKNAKKILIGMSTLVAGILALYTIYFGVNLHYKRAIVIFLCCIICLLPLVICIMKKKGKYITKKYIIQRNNGSIFLSGAVFLVILIGAVIPASVIKSSPQEFADIYCFVNPLWFVCKSVCYAIGTFIVWTGVFYCMANKKIKAYFELTIWLICGIAVIDYMCFGERFWRIK